jgi:glucose/arabinose dehydrogenase
MKNYVLALLLLLAANNTPAFDPLFATKTVEYELVNAEVSIPWGMVWLPNGDMLISEKEGLIKVLRNGEFLDPTIQGVPETVVQGQGGLMDLALHPNFEKNGWIYIAHSSPAGGGKGANTAITRARLDGMKLVEHKLIYKADPNTKKGQHFGGRIAFDKEGYLYFSIGDRGNRDVNPQDYYRDCGKIYRLNDDGTIPEDNPFVDIPSAKTAIYSYGHRNPQGMAMNPETGQIWTHEHGPKGGDEVNIIEAGKNYGWPVISYGVNYSGTKFAEGTKKPGMEQPVWYWVPSIAPSGMTFVTSDRYSAWKGDLLVGSLKFGYLVHLTVNGNKISSQEILFEGIGRVRNVRQGPDGYIYLAVENKGIYRIKTFD